MESKKGPQSVADLAGGAEVESGRVFGSKSRTKLDKCAGAEVPLSKRLHQKTVVLDSVAHWKRFPSGLKVILLLVH